MTNEDELKLYLISNPVPFQRFEDHEAALQIQLHDLVERAIAEHEDPIALIEGYLNTSYHGGNTTADIASYLKCCDHMRTAMHQLRDRWSAFDPSLDEEGIAIGWTSRGQATQVFTEITLRTYLEALSNVIHA